MSFLFLFLFCVWVLVSICVDGFGLIVSETGQMLRDLVSVWLVFACFCATVTFFQSSLCFSFRKGSYRSLETVSRVAVRVLRCVKEVEGF